MSTKGLIWLTLVPAFVNFTPRADGQIQAGLYRIVSGSYRECCGIAGELLTSLPNETQAYIRLTLEQGPSATMTFLGEDRQTPYRVLPCPTGAPMDFSFSHGLLFSDRLFFHVDPGPAPCGTYWNYAVSNSSGGLSVDGVLASALSSGADVVHRFSHSNVVAVLTAEVAHATVRVSEVEICWSASTNTTYQLQYRSQLTGSFWTDLGPPRSGDGTTNCITDKVPRGEPQRFYRVLTVP
jgi:hypothetical protein